MIERLKKGMNRVLNPLTVTGLLILIQVGYFVLIIANLSANSYWFTVVFSAAAVVMALYVIWRDDNPAYKMGWLILICLLPILGATMYLFFGNKRPAKPLMRKIEPMELAHRKDLEQKEILDHCVECPRTRDTINYVVNHGPYPAWKNTKTRYYPLADYAYPELLEDLEKAEHTIFMEYFIISEGGMWRGIFDILKRKAEQGVDVRLIYDDFGSLPTMPKKFVKELKSAGIKVHAFNPLKPILSLIYNNRDHRKMTIIDGYICYTGGFNLADEYINEEERFGHWKDSGLRLEGDAVWNYTVMFLTMWNAFVPTEIGFGAYKPHVHHPEPFESDGLVQPYSDTPLDEENVGENVYLEILNQAKDYVYIFTPYLVIDSEMQTALSMAAKRGVDVRLVTPGIPDKKMVFRLTRSYYRPLIKAGVRIYEYKPGFIHAKSFLADDQIGVVGTINMDYRSLYLHFECATLMLGCDALNGLKKDCLETFERSKEVKIEDTKQTFFGILLDGLLRAMSPLM